MIFPIYIAQKTIFLYRSKITSRVHFVYIFLLFGMITCLACLPLIYIDISVKASGITRPTSERTEVKSLVSGIIDSVLFREGALVQKDAIILRIKDVTTQSKRTLNHFEITQREQFIKDLSLLGSGVEITSALLPKLVSPLYREQASRFLHQKADQEASLKKANRELEINTSLARDKVISQKELFDVQITQERTDAAYKAFMREQQSNWQQDIARYQLELSQYEQQLKQVNIDAAYYYIKAPVSGVIQGINTRYTGGLLQANEVLCSISPEEGLVGECYVPSRDIGLLRPGQRSRYQFEAFDYNYFGVLTGAIISIDNDFTVVDNKPVFKIRCSFDSTRLHLKNGFTGNLKKGMGFQANFIVARRSLWQLLFDKLDNWLNPNAPSKTTIPSN